MTQRTIFLSRSERRIGGRYYLRFSTFNGFGSTFLADTTITLLAIHFGANNTQLGLISAMMFITGVTLLVIPRIFQGKKVVRVAFWAWLVRGLLGLPYGLLLFLEGRTAVALILILYAMFCSARTLGLAMLATIQKRLTVSTTQSDVIFRSASSFQASQIMARFTGFLIMSLKFLGELTGLLIQPALGVMVNTMAAFSLRKIPNRNRVDYVKGENLFTILRRNMADRERRRILLLRWISLAEAILFAMVIPFLRRGAGMDSASIFMYSIAVSLGSFISSMLLRPLASRAGSRPVLFFAAVPGMILFLFWTFVPASLSLAAYAVAGFITMFVLNAVLLGASGLLMLITPDNEAVGFSAMETFVTSLLALLLGLGAGFLADVSGAVSRVSPVNSYGLVFFPAAAGFAVQAFMAVKVKEAGSMGLRDSLQLITNIGNLRAWQALNALENTSDPVKRKTLVHSVGHSRAPIASPEIRRILSDPLSQEKGELIDALFFTRRPELTSFLCGEALERSAFHRERAVFALGSYPGAETRRTLELLLDDADSRIRAAAAKSLGRTGVTDPLERVYAMWQQAGQLHERLDYMIALFHMDPQRRYISDLFSPALVGEGERSERTLFTLLSRQFGMTPDLGTLYRDEAEQQGRGLELLLEEARDTRFLMQNEAHFDELWRQGGFSRIWELCRKALPGVSAPPAVQPVVQALASFSAAQADAANTLAALYFTYQILTAETAE